MYPTLKMWKPSATSSDLSCPHPPTFCPPQPSVSPINTICFALSPVPPGYGKKQLKNNYLFLFSIPDNVLCKWSAPITSSTCSFLSWGIGVEWFDDYVFSSGPDTCSLPQLQSQTCSHLMSSYHSSLSANSRQHSTQKWEIIEVGFFPSRCT